MKNNSAINSGVEAAIFKIGAMKIERQDDLLMAFAEAVTLADTIGDMYRLYAAKNAEDVHALAEQIGEQHSKMIRVVSSDNSVRIEIKDYLLPH